MNDKQAWDWSRGPTEVRLIADVPEDTPPFPAGWLDGAMFTPTRVRVSASTARDGDELWLDIHMCGNRIKPNGARSNATIEIKLFRDEAVKLPWMAPVIEHAQAKWRAAATA